MKSWGHGEILGRGGRGYDLYPLVGKDLGGGGGYST